MTEFTNIQEFKKSVIVGTGVFFAVKLILFPLGVIVGIVLSRILDPVAFGIYGILSFFVFTSSQFSELGFGAFLIQKKETPLLKEYRTVFTLRMILAAGMLFLVWILSPFLLKHFNLTREGAAMLKIFSLVIISEAFSSVPRAILQRNLSYKKIGILDVVNAMSYQLMAITFALLGFKAWSFIIAGVFSSCSTSLLYFFLAPWNMGFKLDSATIKHVVSFGSFFQLSSMTALLRDNIIVILGGLAFGPSAVGYLSWALSLMVSISAIFHQMIGRVAFPAVSRIQSNPKAVSALFSKSIRYLMILTTPCMFFLFVLSKEAITIVFKTKWLPAIPALISFGILSLICHFVTIGDNVLKGLGKVKEDFFIMSVWTLASWMLSLILLPRFGYNAIAVGWAVSALIPATWITYMLNKNSPIHMLPILRPVIASALAAYAVFLVKNAFVINLYTLLLLGGMGFVIYFILLSVIEGKEWRNEMKELIDLLVVRKNV